MDASVSDSGQGTDVVSVVGQATVPDSGSGADTVEAEGRVTIEESGVATETIQSSVESIVQDAGEGIDYAEATRIVPVQDSGLGIDIIYRVQGEISLDDVSLPHVLIINVGEPSVIKDLPVMDALPYRKQLGKRGRSLRIQGWTDSLSVLETLRGYDDGEKHLLILPTGDSLRVHVTDVLTPKTVEKGKTYDYTLVMVEVVT